MKTVYKLLLMLGLLSPMLLGAQCTANVRDAIVGGAVDFISGTTTSLLEQWIYPGTEAEAD